MAIHQASKPRYLKLTKAIQKANVRLRVSTRGIGENVEKVRKAVDSLSANYGMSGGDAGIDYAMQSIRSKLARIVALEHEISSLATEISGHISDIRQDYV